MSSVRSWLRSSLGGEPPHPGPSSPSEISSVDGKIADIQDAMEAADMVMNDDIRGCETRLRAAKDRSTFHQLALGAALLVQYLLGASKDVLVEAVDVFQRCEARALVEAKKAQKSARRDRWLQRTLRRRQDGGSASIYSPGTEFVMVHLQAQLLGTVATILQNPKSIKDSVVALYKLRKFVKTLDRIADAEGRAMKRQRELLAGKLSLSDDDEFEVIDAADEAEEDVTAAALEEALEDDWTEVDEGDAALPTEDAIENIIAKLEINHQDVKAAPAAPAGRKIEPELDPSLLLNPIDIFIHTSANLCYGMLLLARAAVPPSFSRLLSVLGFQDDQDRGMRMLWQASKFADVSTNGAIAGLLILTYYNETMTSADILPSETDIQTLAAPGELIGFPKARCQSLVAILAGRFPKSGLVSVEAGRLLAYDRKLTESISVLDVESQTPWITFFNRHEKAMHAMFQMNWVLMRDTFLRCAPFNYKDSPEYHYFAACAEVELYRDCFHRAKALSLDESRQSDRTAAEHEAALCKKAAAEHFHQALTGHRNFMCRQNIHRWTRKAADLGIDLVDAIGVSPAQEQIFLWYGTGKMQNGEERSLGDLSWDRCTAGTEEVVQIKADPLEGARRGLCKAALLRSLGRFGEARWALQEEVFKHDRCVTRGLASAARVSGRPQQLTAIQVRSYDIRGPRRVHSSRRTLRGGRHLLERRLPVAPRRGQWRPVPPQKDPGVSWALGDRL